MAGNVIGGRGCVQPRGAVRSGRARRLRLAVGRVSRQRPFQNAHLTTNDGRSDDMLRRMMSAALERLARVPGAEVHDVRGFRVVVENGRPDIATAAVLARLDEALALIERHQPWRFRHLRRDLLQFRVARFACRGAYFPDERTCLTELTFLARTDITAAP